MELLNPIITGIIIGLSIISVALMATVGGLIMYTKSLSNSITRLDIKITNLAGMLNSELSNMSEAIDNEFHEVYVTIANERYDN